MAAALLHTYRYDSPSVVDAGRLHLASSAVSTEAAPFLRARVRQPRLVATAMRLVSDVVRSRHHIPAAMLERMLLESDPVLTWGQDTLRVEGFSSCAGIYVRADVHEAALEPTDMRPGTTNVDFNAPMRAALGRTRDTDGLALEVGTDGVTVEHDGVATHERTVKLPLRWLRGFGEAQAVQARMQPRLQLDRAAALRFLRSLPRGGRSSDAAWVVQQGRSVRLSSAARPGAVRVAGLARLRALESGLSVLQRLTVHADARSGASCWSLEGQHVRLCLVLSPETWRGFSGEGQLLSRLAVPDAAVAELRGALHWQSALDPDTLAAQDMDRERLEAGLARLASEGLLGFDVHRGSWFHRVLPFDLDALEASTRARHPRLRSALALLEDDAVTITTEGDDLHATVRSGDVVHRVNLQPGHARCTCPWYAKHQGERGPCKHVLAVELHLARRDP